MARLTLGPGLTALRDLLIAVRGLRTPVGFDNLSTSQVVARDFGDADGGRAIATFFLASACSAVSIKTTGTALIPLALSRRCCACNSYSSFSSFFSLFAKAATSTSTSLLQSRARGFLFHLSELSGFNCILARPSCRCKIGFEVELDIEGAVGGVVQRTRFQVQRFYQRRGRTTERYRLAASRTMTRAVNLIFGAAVRE